MGEGEESILELEERRDSGGAPPEEKDKARV